ncbi:Aldo/keto reductase [Amanita rubescens]|nr:Aldo/keto reductase [Amanita rubescens]KAF8343203.1 Aldo/keto reductase [Amanita rubescens]
MTSVPSFKLNNGNSIPAVGIGCWMGHVGEGDHVTSMVKSALQIGYRHIDTASDEESVGRAIKEAGVPRDDLFITTKLAGEDHGRVAQALDISLRKLGIEYVDLYLMHWPQALKVNELGDAYAPDQSPTFIETWVSMQNLLASGKVKNIGVSNFSVKTLNELLSHCQTQIIPAVNQIEAHPSLPQHELIRFCKERGIVVTAYSPIAKNKLANNETLMGVARRRGVTPTQVLLSWGVQRGTAVIPKTEREDRMKENIKLVELSDEDMRVLDGIHEEPGMHKSVCGFHSSKLGGSCFGWTYEQLGWDMVTGGIVPRTS